MVGVSRLALLRRRLAATPLTPALRRARRRAEILRRTGRLHPDHIDLAASGNRIFVDPHDRRGRVIVDGLGRGNQPALIALWQAAIRAVAPTLVIDVGANYGEFVLNGRYPAPVRVLAIEANPAIVPILRRSIADHPDGSRIELHPVLATDHDAGTAVLRIDPTWSGSAGTGLDRAADGSPTMARTVARRTVDSLVGPPDAPGAVVVKIDTEGSEREVLAGMAEVLAAASTVVALVEFDPAHLRRAGTDPDALFAELLALGRCWSVSWEGVRTPTERAPGAPSDLLVVSTDDAAEALGLPIDR